MLADFLTQANHSPTAAQSDAKRKTLASQAAEYPPRPSTAVSAATIKTAVKGQALAAITQPTVSIALLFGLPAAAVTPYADQIIQLKQPSRYPSNASSTSTSSFAKSFGPGRILPTDRPSQNLKASTQTKPPQSKSQVQRPKTSHGLRDEDEYTLVPTGNGTPQNSEQQRNVPVLRPLHHKKTRAVRPTTSSGTRESSLTARFNGLSINDISSSSHGSQVTSSSSCPTSSTISNASLVRPKAEWVGLKNPPPLFFPASQGP